MWQWGVCGKHPSATDYFNLGQKVPMLEAFADWIEKGYRSIAAKKESPVSFLSWRFWARGPRRDILSCGILRDSTDSIGRPYPFLILGMGPLNDWETQWNHTPCACEKTWNQMESISARVFRDLKSLEDEIRGIKAPDPQWHQFLEIDRELADVRADAGRPNGSATGYRHIKDLEDRIIEMAAESEIIIPVEAVGGRDHFETIHLLHSLMKLHARETPKVVFMGGNAMRSYLAFFNRPIALQDFIRLWSLS